MSKLKTGIDIDGTISTAYCWLPLFNQIACQNLTSDDITDYDIHKVFGIDNLWDIIMSDYSKEYFNSVDIRDNAPDVINKLIELNMIEPHVITARDASEYKVARTKEYLSKCNLDISDKDLYMLGSHDKLAVANELQLDVMIEDNPATAIDFAKNGIVVLLLDTNYNKCVEHVNIIRCKDWLDVFRIVIELYYEHKEVSN